MGDFRENTINLVFCFTFRYEYCFGSKLNLYAMVNCFVFECHHRSDRKDHPCKGFTSFPSYKRVRSKWIQLIRRGDREPCPNARVCSCHFIDGNMNALPSIFPWNQKPENRNRRMRNSKTNADSTESKTTQQKYSETTSLDLEPPSTSDTLISDESVFEVSELYTKENLEEELKSLKEEVLHLRIQDTKVHLLEMEVQSLKEEVCRLRIESVEVDSLREDTKKLKAENERLEKKNCCFQNIVQDDELCYHYTGLSGDVVRLLRDLLNKISETYNINAVKVLNSSDQLLLTLIRLRRNLSYVDLAFRFGVAVTTVQTVFSTTLSVLHEVLFCQFMNVIPSREKNNMFIPECFKSYPNVKIVLDCTEISCDIPKDMNKQKATYSNYKGKNTIKYQVGCAINGCITHCSSGYPGSTSDKAIVKHSGVLSQLVAGDVVLADKGFLVSDLLPPGVSLNIPSFLNDSGFAEDNVFENRSKSRARIHIERINSRLKRFLICRHFPQKLFSSCDIIVQTCCALVN